MSQQSTDNELSLGVKISIFAAALTLMATIQQITKDYRQTEAARKEFLANIEGISNLLGDVISNIDIAKQALESTTEAYNTHIYALRTHKTTINEAEQKRLHFINRMSDTQRLIESRLDEANYAKSFAELSILKTEEAINSSTLLDESAKLDLKEELPFLSEQVALCTKRISILNPLKDRNQRLLNEINLKGKLFLTVRNEIILAEKEMMRLEIKTLRDIDELEQIKNEINDFKQEIHNGYKFENNLNYQ